MPKNAIIARQSAFPTGLLGWFIARVMAFDTAAANAHAVERLAVKPGEDVLEVGCGHGRTLTRIAHCAGDGFVAGVDPSAVMRRHAHQRNRAGVASGRVTISDGTAEALPFADASFDCVLTVHTTYFWSDLEAGLREIRRVLRPGGRILVGLRTADDATSREYLPESVYTLHSIAEFEAAVERAGFLRIQTDYDSEAESPIAWMSAVV